MDRRRQYYIDKKFQKRFLILFGSVAFVIAVSNFLFYKFKIVVAIENMIYRSHFVFDNLLKYFEREFFEFSIINTVLIFIIVLLVYSYFRLKIDRFFSKFYMLINELASNKTPDTEIISDIPDEFEGIRESIRLFVETVISNRKRQEKLISQAEKIIKN